MNAGMKAIQNHPRCDALARTTGKPCKKPAMANGRCRNHGGKSLKGKNSPSYKHGMRTKEGVALRKKVKEIHAILNRMLKEAGAS